MIFYHFTTRAAIEPIREHGIYRGEAPIDWKRVERAVNLTTDPDPGGHGLDHGGSVITDEQAALYAVKGHPIRAGTALADKLEARIKLRLPLSDTRLKSWRSWSRKHCEPGFARQLELAAGQDGRKAATWWLYFDVVPPEAFLQIDLLK